MLHQSSWNVNIIISKTLMIPDPPTSSDENLMAQLSPAWPKYHQDSAWSCTFRRTPVCQTHTKRPPIGSCGWIQTRGLFIKWWISYCNVPTTNISNFNHVKTLKLLMQKKQLLVCKKSTLSILSLQLRFVLVANHVEIKSENIDRDTVPGVFNNAK